MSNIHVIPQAASQASKGSKADLLKPGRPTESDKPVIGQGITHAWSIGTTEAARFAPPAEKREYCPPEVYIG